jgi:hypothetical protein
LAEEACQSLVNAGLEVYPWRYSRGGKSNWTRELEGYKRDLEWGAQGIVVDAEIHWGNEHKDEAHLFVDELLELNCFVADAPWPYIGWHPEYPDAFGRLHARMPQLYWTEISAQGAKHHMTQMRKQWAAWEAKQRSEGKDYLIKPLWPIGVTYGKDELAKLGAKGCPGTFYLQDLKDFIAMNEEDPKALWSLYSLEASAPTALGYLRSLYAPSNLCL